MGGDSLNSCASEDESSTLENEYPELSSDYSQSYRDEDESGNGLTGVVTNHLDEVGHPISSTAVELDGNLRRRKIAYDEIMKNYDDLWVRSENLDQAKKRILRYTPGSWINNGGGKNVGNYVVPKMITLLLVGPKGSGKSSLVNRISRVFEDDNFASERAQVTYNSSSGEGTFFIGEYMIPRGAATFCLFDTRSLSENFGDNEEMLQHWMIKGLRHGELVVRDSDSSSLKMTLLCKAQQSGTPSSEIRMVNFVIFVVNGFSVLRSMNSDKEEDKKYMEMVVKTFKYPYLSFKDDKPIVVVTHSDLLSLRDRARVRIYLGEMMGVPPAKQIFDIPDNSDQATELAIVDMIRHCLEHVDKNLPYKESREDRRISLNDSLIYKLFSSSLLKSMFIALLLGIACGVFPMNPSWNYKHRVSASTANWHSKSEVEHPHKHHESSMQIPSNAVPKSSVNHSPEQQRRKKQEPEMTSPPASASNPVATTKSVPSSPLKSVMDRSYKHRGSQTTSSKTPHSKTEVKWHKIRHLWLDDDTGSHQSKPKVKWHKIRHLWLADDSEVKWHKTRHLWSADDFESKHPKSAVKWHKIRHLWADDD